MELKITNKGAMAMTAPKASASKKPVVKKGGDLRTGGKSGK